MSLPVPTLADEPLLTSAEVVQLATQIEAGLLAREARRQRSPMATDEELQALEALGEQAWQRFVRANLRLVAMVAGQAAARTRLSEADLFQEGCLGLMTALQRFDHRRGHAFATYALVWIRSCVGAASARRLGTLNLPTSRAEQLRAARGVEAELGQRLGRTPQTREVAAALGRPERWTATLLAHRPPEPLDGLEVSLAWSPPTTELATDGDEVRRLLHHLEWPERQVLELRLGFTVPQPCSLAETARRLGMSVGRVRRLEERGLERLRAHCRHGTLEAWPEPA
ncbi:sigma-70 family RNA polymerase sigma factor [uncultured Friedmanniella sp.]|uniref:sigma-70 family RNA polymerase sigma factor n=1 Tax=uncultured Friedmanniella sp. TaxID=335381 RepID=UPI0035CC1B39